jgi:hypothetical protein
MITQVLTQLAIAVDGRICCRTLALMLPLWTADRQLTEKLSFEFISIQEKFCFVNQLRLYDHQTQTANYFYRTFLPHVAAGSNYSIM